MGEYERDRIIIVSMPKNRLDFVNWTKMKIRLEERDDITFFVKEREIWWTSLGVNIGHEQDGKNESFERPVLVVKRFNNAVVWGVPMTSVEEKDRRFYFPVSYNDEPSFVVLSQIRLFSTKRFLRKVRTISKKEFEAIKQEIKAFL